MKYFFAIWFGKATNIAYFYINNDILQLYKHYGDV